jgi:osmoprotectant transport system substrate-binding protein
MHTGVVLARTEMPMISTCERVRVRCSEPEGGSRQMRHCSVRVLAIVALAATLLGVTGVGSAHARSVTRRDAPITVASFDFAESRLLAEIYAGALERAGLSVHRTLGLGPRELVAPALVRGLVDVVPEYAGTALQFLSLGRASPEPDVAATHAALVDALEGTSARALAAAPAQDANAFVVRRAVADRLGLSKLSDLREHAGRLTFGGPPECATRPLCLDGLREVYGVEFAEVVPLDAGGPLTRQALSTGIIDVALLFSTDPALGDDDELVELADDRALQPAENVTPIVRRAAADRFGSRLVDTLDAVSARLDTETLRVLNARAATSSVRATATQWLDAEQLP